VQAAELIRTRTLRTDAWLAEPLRMAAFLTVVLAYAGWATIVDNKYFASPYISPIYSPCLAANCEHDTFRVLGNLGVFSPALLIVWIPVGFRMTCYYYRKAYYRSFFGSPPACAVRDVARGYSGETRFPFVLMNVHRYLFWLSWPIIGFLSWDVFEAFRFRDGLGLGIGTIILFVNTVFFLLYSLSCHSCRHIVGGGLDAFSASPARYRLWRFVSRLNERHGAIALTSLTLIPVSDLYIRLMAHGVIARGFDRLF
jgi:hypothetical protein